MKEWNDKYNPFNSLKVLMYPEHLAGYAKEEYLPPVTIAIDPSNKCNLDCVWCNASKVRSNDKAMITIKEAERLAKFLHKWGVKGTCIAGGGEPLMNKDAFNTLLLECYDYNISNSVITNGTLLDKECIDNIATTCRWIGVSVDAGNKKTFKKLKGVDAFDKVIENIKKLRKRIDELGSKCEIGYKFLLHPDNQNEIYEAVELAKKIGVHDFQLRPVGLKKKVEYCKEVIDRQLDNALKLKDFRVYGVRHKYGENLEPTFDFKFCRACSIHPVFCADGTFQLCIDRRGDSKTTLCNWKPDPSEILKIWNTDKHRKLLDNVNFKECPKCTFNEYNKVVENVFIKDKMCRNHV